MVVLFEYGAHTGVDLALPENTRGIAITDTSSRINETIFDQMIKRIRSDNVPIDVVYNGANGFDGLMKQLEAKQNLDLALAEIQFKETLLRNTVDQLFVELLNTSKTSAASIQQGIDYASRLDALQERWKEISDLSYDLSRGEMDAQKKLQKTLEQVQSIYKQVEYSIQGNTDLVAKYKSLSGGIDKLAISFVPKKPLHG